MFYSLRFGILMAMFAVAAVAILTVTVVTGFSTRTQFDRYIETGRTLREQRLQEAVVVWSRNAGDETTGMQSITALQYLTDSVPAAEASPDSDNLHFRLLGTIGTLEFVNSANNTAGERIRFEVAPDGSVAIYQGQESIGTLYIDPINELELLPAQINFMETVNWTLIVAALLAGAAAIGLTVILSRRILHPVAALTSAARRMEGGDFSQKVQVEARGEISELAQAFNALAETLERNEELRRNMVTDIAHELRTPLTNIRGYLEALHDGVVKPETGIIDLLYDEAMLLNRLIQDLQELALAEAGQLSLEKQPLEMDDMIQQATSALQQTARRKQITLHTTLPPALPPVFADQRRVAQILRNLISNAIQHTPPAGRVTVCATTTETMMDIAIRDTGEGIASDHLPFVFERFYRADPSRNRATGGAGLGLAIVKQLTELQGGTVTVESIAGEGATFSFRLPLYTPQR